MSELKDSISGKDLKSKYNKIIFIPSGRLGNAIFRYLGCIILNICNPSLKYMLESEVQYDTRKQYNNNNYIYYPGLDHSGDDLYHFSNKNNIEKESTTNYNSIGFNTLGYLKHNIDIDNLKSNLYINENNGQGIYVKKSLIINDQNFEKMFYKDLKYFNIIMDGYFQFGYIYLKYKSLILNYIEEHKDKHMIETDLHEKIYIKTLIDDIELSDDKKYDIVIHIRLGDFNGRVDYIEKEYYIKLFEKIFNDGNHNANDNTNDNRKKKICLLYQPTNRPEDNDYIETCLKWFKNQKYPIDIKVETNSLLIDFNIMKQAKILICSMSTLSWTAAYLSKHIELCYMPNYNFYKNNERKDFFFHKPIENTILYDVKSTPKILSSIKPIIMTLPQYSMRLNKLNDFIFNISKIGLDCNIFNGVYGKDIRVYDAAYKETAIKHITWNDITYFYDTRIRLNGIHMTPGEFGCAWSHINLLQQLVNENDSTNYYLILEDDVELIKPLDELYELLNHIPEDTDICHLAKSNWYPFQLTNQVNSYFYECSKRFFNKTTAYIISKKGAKKVLEYTKNSINVPADDLFNMIYRLTPNFKFYVPTSYYFKEQDNIVSTIEDINKK